MKIPGKIRFIVLISSIILLQNCTKAAEGSTLLHPLLNFLFIPLLRLRYYLSGISYCFGRKKQCGNQISGRRLFR
jgi:hypothetical protein